MLELPEPTSNPLLMQRQLLEAIHAQLAVLTEVRDALRDLAGDRPAPDRPLEPAAGRQARK